MLTATYSLVAIAAEQDKARSLLNRLKQYIHAAWRGLQDFDFTFLETAFGKLVQLDGFCRSRKIEEYLIPALRSAADEAGDLIAEWDRLAAKGRAILHAVGDQMAVAFDAGAIRINDVCHAMEAYCGYLHERLEKEDNELLPMARRVFSVEQWFSLAANFLSDGEAAGRKRRSFSPVRSSTSSAAAVQSSRTSDSM